MATDDTIYVGSRSHISVDRLLMSGAVRFRLPDGISGGQLLMVTATPIYGSVTLAAGLNVRLPVASRTLDTEDILLLIWVSAVGRSSWCEVSYSDNN